MMENVPGLASDKRMDRILVRLRQLGYTVPEQRDEVVRVLNASSYGVPQRRRRMILMTTMDGVVPFAPAQDSLATAGAALDAVALGVGQAGCSDDPAHDHGEARSEKVKAFIRDIPHNGGSRSDLPDDRQLGCHGRVSGFYDVYGRIDPAKPSVTITSGCINPSKGRFLHPTEDRTITVREAAALQSFPLDYVLSMSRGKGPAALMVGNAFPPLLIEPHAVRLREHLTTSD